MAPPPPQETSRSESVPVLTEVVAVDVLTVASELKHQQEPAVVVTVDVLTAARELKQQKQEEEDGGQQVWQYLDVRTEEEMAKGHLHNSLNVPYMFLTPQGTREKNPAFVEQVASLFVTDQHILVGCQSGKRSELACVDLLAAGFMNVKNVGGGYIAWVDNGLPILVPESAPAPESAPTLAPESAPTPAEPAT